MPIVAQAILSSDNVNSKTDNLIPCGSLDNANCCPGHHRDPLWHCLRPVLPAALCWDRGLRRLLLAFWVRPVWREHMSALLRSAFTQHCTAWEHIILSSLWLLFSAAFYSPLHCMGAYNILFYVAFYSLWLFIHPCIAWEYTIFSSLSEIGEETSGCADCVSGPKSCTCSSGTSPHLTCQCSPHLLVRYFSSPAHLTLPQSPHLLSSINSLHLIHLTCLPVFTSPVPQPSHLLLRCLLQCWRRVPGPPAIGSENVPKNTFYLNVLNVLSCQDFKSECSKCFIM